MHDTQASADERWSRNMSKNLHRKKIMFWKEIIKIRKETSGNVEGGANAC